jgi:hypothetical protein
MKEIEGGSTTRGPIHVRLLCSSSVGVCGWVLSSLKVFEKRREEERDETERGSTHNPRSSTCNSSVRAYCEFTPVVWKKKKKRRR